MNEKIKVLIVDDEPNLRFTLSAILESKGFDVAAVESGFAAMEAVQKTHYPVVIMDIKMPGMSGVEAFLQIKRIDPTAAVIMMTGYALEKEINQALAEGAFSVLSKPLDIEKILGLIAESLGKRTMVMVVDGIVEGTDKIILFIREKGYHVVQVKDWTDCLEKLQSNIFQVILLPDKLNGVEGLEALREIRKRRPDVSVIMLTGHSWEEWAEEVTKDHAFAVLKKPVSVEDILNVMTNLLKRKS